jgi:cysteine desulfuration protein SufE
MSLPSRLQDRLDTLALFPDRADRIELLISIADGFRPVEPEVAEPPFAEDHRVPGCESESFVWAFRGQVGLELRFAVLNPQGISAMAMATILQEDLRGAAPEELRSVTDEVVFQIFGRELSMGKTMGLTGMCAMARRLGLAALGAGSSA